MKNIRPVLRVLALALASPILIDLLRLSIQALAGCPDDIKTKPYCSIFGIDMSEVLYTMFLIGWSGITTISYLAVVLVIWGVIEFFWLFKKPRK